MGKVIVYSTPSCPYCVMAKDYLRQNNVEFEDVDVSADQARAREMVEKSGQMGVPVLDIGGTIIMGFNKPEIDAALGIGKSQSESSEGDEESFDGGDPGDDDELFDEDDDPVEEEVEE